MCFKQEKRGAAVAEAAPTRLADDELARLCDLLAQAGFSLCGDLGTKDRLTALRLLYEPHACALANYLKLQLPVWAPPVKDETKRKDQWATVAELRSPSALGESADDACERAVDGT
jgi:hypothetical protein